MRFSTFCRIKVVSRALLSKDHKLRVAPHQSSTKWLSIDSHNDIDEAEVEFSDLPSVSQDRHPIIPSRYPIQIQFLHVSKLFLDRTHTCISGRVILDPSPVTVSLIFRLHSRFQNPTFHQPFSAAPCMSCIFLSILKERATALLL